jgi:hypothetical protein
VTGWPTTGFEGEDATITVEVRGVAAEAIAVEVRMLAARTRQRRIGLPIHLIIENPFIVQDVSTDGRSKSLRWNDRFRPLLASPAKPPPGKVN